MATKRIPKELAHAMEIARQSGWPVAIRNDKAIISAPDGTAITMGFNPNDESMKVFRSNCRKYDLDGSGPARTPAEKEALIKAAELEGEKAAKKANAQRVAYDAEQAKKRAEAAVANEKAQEATEQGMKPEAPKVQPKPKGSPDGVIFPAFDPELVGSMEYSKFLLPNGHYFCPECLQDGAEFSARKPQGLATHRGFRHQTYLGEAVLSSQETSRVQLPDDVQTALDLLRVAFAEHMGSDDSARVTALEAQLSELTQQAKLDMKKANAEYQELKDASENALRAQKLRITDLEKELSSKQGVHEAEIKSLLKNFQELLAQLSTTINELSPAQAVGKIDALLSQYLKK